ncbi:MAG: hypothetical protein NVSMB62_23190 [Acidobacteriaceae bacterium]
MTPRPSRLAAALLTFAAAQAAAHAQAPTPLRPAAMPRIASVDERFQSYNIEMLEVTGGNFWKPYSAPATPAPTTATSAVPGMRADMYAYRPAKDLSNHRLRTLAAALAPAYVRVSGTWANNTFFPEGDEAPAKPPAGFNGVLTHQQWKGVVDFAHATHADILTSFATSVGTRDATGQWSPAQAQRFADYTRSVGGRIAATEYMNEPTFALIGGAPKGYSAQDYGRDFKAFHAFVERSLPGTILLGPGSVGETTNPGQNLGTTMPGFLPTKSLLDASSTTGVDAFSYHFYGGASKRCVPPGSVSPITPETALSDEWLARTDSALAFYRPLRDQYYPGKPLWVTETAETACGGDPWAATFLDTFRYLNQLGTLARSGVQVVAHNTLAASDYGLLDEDTFAPRPNYWAALLWRRLMGSTVLDAGIPSQPGLHVYAHCLKDKPGGIALLVIQNDRSAPHSLELPLGSERYTLSARTLTDTQVLLTEAGLALGANDQLPALQPAPAAKGTLSFAPATVTFLAIPQAANQACR